jgi:hypothetical protein
MTEQERFEHEDIIEVIKQASQWINEKFCDSVG